MTEPSTPPRDTSRLLAVLGLAGLLVVAWSGLVAWTLFRLALHLLHRLY